MAPLIWLVTGCSSGLGETFVHRILARGDRIIATGRKSAERLAHLKDTGAAILELDVTWPEKEVQNAINKAISIYGGIDVLVNNAAYAEITVVEEITQELWLQQFNTNFFGPANVTRALLPHFRNRRAGKIAFVGSILGLEANPGFGPYSAAKFAMEGYVDCLQKELSTFGIQSIVFEPGFFRTKLMNPSNSKLGTTTISDYQAFFTGLKEFFEGGDGKQPGDPIKAVELMIDVLKSEGVAKGRTMPRRLPIGPDTIEVINARCNELLNTVKEWEDVISSTNIDENREDFVASMPQQDRK